MKHLNFNEKSLVDKLFEKFKKMLSLSGFRFTIGSLITEEYKTAIDEIDNKLGTPINIIPNERNLDFLKKYVNDNVQAAGDEISENLRQEIQRGILNGDDIKALTRRVKILFRDKKYKTRLKVILRTELQRANNQGTLDGAKQAEATGLNLRKWVDVTLDDRTSNICKHEFSKYGDKTKAIPLDENFVVMADNKTYRIQIPPFHCNCRSVLRIEVIK